MEETLFVLTLADQQFALPLAVLVRSTLDHLAGSRRLHLTVVDGGIDRGTRERLIASWNDPRLHVEWRAPALNGMEVPITGRIPALTYARLRVPALVPQGCARAIVLDADQIVLTDLGRLATDPFEGALVLSPRDAFIPSVSSANGLAGFRELGLSPDAPYFTGALMVVDVPGWRRERVSERTIAYVAENAARLRTYDQDALNAVLAGRFKELDPRWQVQPRALSLSPGVTPHLDAGTRARLAADPWVVHFSGRLKPWLYPGRGRFDALFRETLARTAFHDHQIPNDARASAYSLYDGRLRRWLYPLEVRADAVLRLLRRRRITVGGPR